MTVKKKLTLFVITFFIGNIIIFVLLLLNHIQKQSQQKYSAFKEIFDHDYNIDVSINSGVYGLGVCYNLAITPKDSLSVFSPAIYKLIVDSFFLRGIRKDTVIPEIRVTYNGEHLRIYDTKDLFKELQNIP